MPITFLFPGASPAHLPSTCLDPLPYGDLTPPSEDAAVQGEPEWYLDRERKREPKEKHINTGQPCDLIQLDTVWQKPFTIVPLAPARPAALAFPHSWLTMRRRRSHPQTPVCKMDGAWASGLELEEGCGWGEVKWGAVRSLADTAVETNASDTCLLSGLLSPTKPPTQPLVDFC